MAQKITLRQLATSSRILLRYLTTYRRPIAGMAVVTVILSATDSIIPLLTGRILDSIMAPSAIGLGEFSLPLVAVLLSTWLVIMIISALLGWATGYFGEWLATVIYYDYITVGFSRLLQLPLSFHTKNSSGNIGSKIQQTANRLWNVIDTLVSLIPNFLSIIGGYVIIALISPYMLLVATIGLVLYAATVIRIAPRLGAHQQKMYTVSGQSWDAAWDSIGNVRAIKQVSGEQSVSQRMRKVFFEKVIPLELLMERLWSKLSLYQRLIIAVVQFTFFVSSLYFINQGTMTIGELVALNGYAAMLFGPLNRLGSQWQNFQNAIITTALLEKQLSQPIEPYDFPGAIQINRLQGRVEFSKVSFQYEKGKRVLSNITATIPAGSTVALVGRSGEGKSTIIDLISGYYLPQKGRVMIDGHDTRTIGLRSLRRHIAVVPQDVALFNDTVRANIAYGRPGASMAQIERAAELAHVTEFVQKFPKKWGQVVGERGIKLSGGQKQRLAIARAILRDPRILILDEPTSALDAESEQFIGESLKQLMQGRTTFIIAHRLSTVRRADIILVIESGRIIEQGTHDELLARADGAYRRLHELQIGLHT